MTGLLELSSWYDMVQLINTTLYHIFDSISVILLHSSALVWRCSSYLHLISCFMLVAKGNVSHIEDPARVFVIIVRNQTQRIKSEIECRRPSNVTRDTHRSSCVKIKYDVIIWRMKIKVVSETISKTLARKTKRALLLFSSSGVVLVFL